MMGAAVLLGRTFTPQEDSPRGGSVVILSYGFGSGGSAAMQTSSASRFSLGNEPYTIIGVMGRGFDEQDPTYGFRFSSI